MADRVLRLPVRWYPTITAPDVPCLETNGRWLERAWPVPSHQTALVLVDCWDLHPIESHQANSGRLCREVIRPLVDACRAAGVTIIHAPSPAQARLYPQWVRYADDADLGFVPAGPAEPWPPAEFRQRTGPYALYERPHYLRPVEEAVAQRRIHPDLEPQPDDFVVATGRQLHRLLRAGELLHLLYAGFAANMCVLYRDYGLKAMAERGYNCVLLRDATLAIEAAHTYDERWLTEAACLAVEMLWGVTTSATAVLEACRLADQPAVADW